MDGPYTMVPAGEYLELRDKADMLEPDGFCAWASRKEDA